MQYRLRTLLMVLAIGPIVLAWFVWPLIQRAKTEMLQREIGRAEERLGIAEKEYEKTNADYQATISQSKAAAQKAANLEREVYLLRSRLDSDTASPP